MQSLRFVSCATSRPAVGPLNLLFIGYWGLSSWLKSGWRVRLAVHLELVVRLRMGGVVCPLMQCSLGILLLLLLLLLIIIIIIIIMVIIWLLFIEIFSGRQPCQDVEIFIPNHQHTLKTVKINGKGKGKAIPLQAWTGPEASRMLRLPDFKSFGT